MSLRILHVEDNPVDADLIRRQLAREAPEITLDQVATLAEARLQLATAEHYDLTLLDLTLPDGSGLELLTEIREARLPQAVVILTGSGGLETAIAALKSGADDYLIKRDDGAGRLASVLRDTVARFHARRLRQTRILRVLYAEHHEADIDLTRRHLARYAPHVRLTVVYDAEQALARLPLDRQAESDFDVVLLDYRLPGQNALELIKTVRQQRGLDLPIVLVTGQGNEAVAAQALRLGVDDFISKHEGYLHELTPTLENVLRQVELEHQRQHLEELVATRTAELEAAMRQAEHLARVKSAFLANMSHEIRTPLNGVLGFAQIGYRESADQPRLHARFGNILESGQLLLGIINDILDFSKIEAGGLTVEQVPIDLNQVIHHVVDLFKDRVAAKQLSLRVKQSRDLPQRMLGDPLRLEQVMLNLMANAFKFTDQGYIELNLARQDAHLVLSVIDTGIGMDDTQLARVFTPFEQADASTTRQFGGTGLGLSISRHLVELMGGSLTASSTPGEGSRFTVRLPLLAATGDEQPSGPPATIEPKGARLAGLSLLVAEDNEINQIILGDMLESEGARVVMTGNGQEALARFTADGPAAYDLVLLDIAMPVMDGHTAARAILALAPQTPIIGQTAYAMADERAACLASGMRDHIAKPIEFEHLVRIVRQYARRAA